MTRSSMVLTASVGVVSWAGELPVPASKKKQHNMMIAIILVFIDTSFSFFRLGSSAAPIVPLMNANPGKNVGSCQ